MKTRMFRVEFVKRLFVIYCGPPLRESESKLPPLRCCGCGGEMKILSGKMKVRRVTFHLGVFLEGERHIRNFESKRVVYFVLLLEQVLKMGQ